ncbi:MAG TPA: Gfo/Idh/MocA family oxidoreductase [Anaerolineaceae bacterium]|nr:Gfo/Idh/MocA family oxidoreductase [Anaerolineaceae bacterium]
MANRVRFAIVGTGMGSDRARKAANTPGAELVAVCSLDVAGGQRLATELGCDFVADYDTLLAREDVDVVGVMTPSGWHCDFAIRALRAGKHAFTTKPMDLRLEKCDEAIRAAQETGRILAVDFESRYLPVNHQVRQAIRSGRLGDMVKNARFSGMTPEFWNACDAVAGPDEWHLWGIPVCGKGEPGQIVHLGHGTAPARFQNIQVG